VKKTIVQNFLSGAFLIISLVSAFMIYSRGLDNHFVSDDWVFLFPVSKVHMFSAVSEFFTFNTGWFVRPTQWIATWVIYQFGGLDPKPYHFTSLILEFINAVLVGWFSYRLSKACDQTSLISKQAGIAVAILFIFSWRHHEAVYWYASINELLSALFRLSSLLLFTYLLDQKANTKFALLGFASLGVYALAIFSKESVIVLPLELVVLISLDQFARGRQNHRLIRYTLILIPFLVLSGLWSHFYLQTCTSSSTARLERSDLLILDTSAVNYVLRFLQYFNANYLGTGFISRSIPLMLVELAAIVLLSILAFVRKRYLWLFAIMWIFISIAPYAVTISKDAIQSHVPVLMLGVADRYMYYSAAGASLLIVISALWLVDEFQHLDIRSSWSRSLKNSITPVAASLALLVYIACNAYKIVKFETDWDRAGEISHSIIQQIHSKIPNLSTGDILCIGALPDNLNGKYIFRNGISQALYLTYSRDDFPVLYAFNDPIPLDQTNCSYFLYYDGDANVVRTK
jgi:hypothetical protein